MYKYKLLINKLMVVQQLSLISPCDLVVTLQPAVRERYQGHPTTIFSRMPLDAVLGSLEYI